MAGLVELLLLLCANQAHCASFICLSKPERQAGERASGERQAGGRALPRNQYHRPRPAFYAAAAALWF